MTAATVIPWLLSAYTLAAMTVAGGRPRLGWTLALAGQPLWFAYSFASADGLGFLPLNVGLCIVYYRNLRINNVGGQRK
jgi:hypothetical protein